MQFSVYCLQSTVFDLHSILLSVQFTGLQLRFDHTVCLDIYFTKTLVCIKIDSAVPHISRNILEFSDRTTENCTKYCDHLSSSVMTDLQLKKSLGSINSSFR